jgi:predicted RNA-binding protein with RPS1 domain
MAQYGAFLTLPGGASGLLHKADMSSESGVSGAFPEGIDLDRELTVVVDAVNATSGRLRLSLRPLERYPGEARRNLTAMMADAAADMATKWLVYVDRDEFLCAVT